MDLSGNRYILKAKEATNDKFRDEFVNLKYVDATFYFKDDTILYVTSDFGLYNNKTLDMIFKNNVAGEYTSSELFAEKAEYSNSKGFLIISENVKIKDIRGTMMAEKLVFDIKNNKLDIVPQIIRRLMLTLIINEKTLEFLNLKKINQFLKLKI